MTRYFFWSTLANSDGSSMLNKMLRYYAWSILVPLVAIGIGMLLVDPAANHPSRLSQLLLGVLGILWIWISHPVIIAEWVANVVVAPESPYGPQTAAWSHVFLLAEFSWIAVWLYTSVKMFRAGLILSACLIYLQANIYFGAGIFVCYSTLVV